MGWRQGGVEPQDANQLQPLHEQRESTENPVARGL